MKKKTVCKDQLMEEAIIEILKKEGSGGKNSEKLVSLNELEDFLTKDFEYSKSELCEVLSKLNSEYRIRLYFKTQFYAPEEGEILVIDKIYLGKIKDAE